MANSLLDTHYYDGKLTYVTHYIPELNYITNAPVEYKIEVIDNLFEALAHKLPDMALNNLFTLKKSIGTPANYDPTNNINADDLLCLCYDHINDEDFVELLIEQLIEMTYGMCAQGRTHRLLQILLPYY